MRRDGGAITRTGQRCFSRCSTLCLGLDKGHHFRTKFRSALPSVAAQTCVEDAAVAAGCTGTCQQQVAREHGSSRLHGNVAAAGRTGTRQQQVARERGSSRLQRFAREDGIRSFSFFLLWPYPPWLIGVVEALKPLFCTIAAASTQFSVGRGGDGRANNNAPAPRTSMYPAIAPGWLWLTGAARCYFETRPSVTSKQRPVGDVGGCGRGEINRGK